MRIDLTYLTDHGRFWSRVQGEDPAGCWLWTGGKKSGGYATFCLPMAPKGRYVAVGAHRVAYAMLRGDVQDDLQLDHLCSNPLCVNPWHLEEVTHMVNIQRRFARERHRYGIAHNFGPAAAAADQFYPRRGVIWRDDPGVHIALPTNEVVWTSSKDYGNYGAVGLWGAILAFSPDDAHSAPSEKS